MKHHKRKQSGILNDFSPSFAMAGGSMGLSILGGKLAPHLPTGTPNAFNIMGSSMSGMIAPMNVLSGGLVTIKMSSRMIKELKRLK